MSRSVLPAVLATGLAVLLERDQALAAHGERRIEKRLLIEPRKRRFEPVHCQTRTALLQHVGDCALNRCRAAYRSAARSPGPSRRCFCRTTPGAEPAVLDGFNGAVKLALDLFDLSPGTFQSAANRSLRLLMLTCVSHFQCSSSDGMRRK